MGIFLEMIRYEIYYLIAYLAIKLLCIIQIRFKAFVRFFYEIGTTIHELMHYTMMKLLFIPVKFGDIHIKRGGSGYVKIPARARASFIKFTLIAFAPLLGGTLFLLYFKEIWPDDWDKWYWIIIKWIIILSILLTISPSKSDFGCILKCIIEETGMFLKQILFLLFSWAIYIAFYERLIPYQIYFHELFELCMILLIFAIFERVWWLITGAISYQAKRSEYSDKFRQKGIIIKKSISKIALWDIMDLENDLRADKKIRKIRKIRKLKKLKKIMKNKEKGGLYRNKNQSMGDYDDGILTFNTESDSRANIHFTEVSQARELNDKNDGHDGYGDDGGEDLMLDSFLKIAALNSKIIEIVNSKKSKNAVNSDKA